MTSDKRDAARYRALKAHTRVAWSEVRGGIALRVYHPTEVRHAREWQGVDLDHAVDLLLQDGEPVCITPEQESRYADYAALRGSEVYRYEALRLARELLNAFQTRPNAAAEKAKCLAEERRAAEEQMAEVQRLAEAKRMAEARRLAQELTAEAARLRAEWLSGAPDADPDAVRDALYAARKARREAMSQEDRCRLAERERGIYCLPANFEDVNFDWLEIDPDLAKRVTDHARKIPEVRAIAEAICLGDESRTLLIGPSGAGKTSLACAAFDHLLHEAPLHRFSEGEAMFLCCATCTSEELEAAETAPLLLLDDLGAELERDDSEDVRRQICRIARMRYDRALATITTSALSFEQIAERYGEHIVRRLGRLVEWPFEGEP